MAAVDEEGGCDTNFCWLLLPKVLGLKTNTYAIVHWVRGALCCQRQSVRIRRLPCISISNEVSRNSYSSVQDIKHTHVSTYDEMHFTSR